MFVAELSEAFKGSLTNSCQAPYAAVDCAAVYGFGSPNAVTIGFLLRVLGQLVAIIGLSCLQEPCLHHHWARTSIGTFDDNATSLSILANHKGWLTCRFYHNLKLLGS